MEKMTCPGCGTPWNGKRCRSCGYEPFREEPRRKRVPTQNGRKLRKKHPFLGFLILLALIWAMLPLLRNWGLKLEAVEQRGKTPEPAFSVTDLIAADDS